MSRLTRKQWLYVGGAAASLLIAMRLCLHSGAHETVARAIATNPVTNSSPAIAIKSPKQTWEAVQPHLKQADQETEQTVDRELQRLAGYFNAIQRDGRLEKFAEDALGLSTKFKLLTEGQDGFNASITRRFEETVLSQRDVESVVANVVSSFNDELDAVDNKLLLAIKADADTPSTVLAGPLPTAPQIKSQFANATHAARVAAIEDIAPTIARELSGFVVMEIAGQAAAQGLAHAGMSRDGKANGVVTFGVGLLAGLVFDYAVQKITDPQGKLVATLRPKLIDISNATSNSTRDLLQELGRQRSAVRRQLVAQAIGVTP